MSTGQDRSRILDSLIIVVCQNSSHQVHLLWFQNLTKENWIELIRAIFIDLRKEKEGDGSFFSRSAYDEMRVCLPGKKIRA